MGVKPEPIAECTQCGKPFVRRNTLHKVCSARCAIRSVREQKKQETAELKLRQEAAKPRAQWIKEAQSAFNRWIRMRDEAQPCISCGRWHDGQWHAGHYLSTGARPELRFDEMNVHKQCQPCNTHLHGNIVAYRAGLISRIGIADVERLEGPQSPRKYSVEELRAIKAEYKRRLAAGREFNELLEAF